MFRCNFCGAEFFEPEIRTSTENLDGENGWWTHSEGVCPWCGDEDFEEIEEC